MIVDAIFSLVLGLLQSVLGVLPAWTPPGWEIGTATQAAGTYLGYAGAWFNLDLLADIIATLAIAVPLAATVRVSIWLYERFPGKAA